MKGINHVVILGTLGRDPETKTFQNGGSITSFSVAVNESWNDKTTGEKKEHTEWMNIVANGKLAEICSTYLKKGSKVYICGKIKTRKWKGADGADKYTTEIVANDMQMLDDKKDAVKQHSPSQQIKQQNDYDDFDTDSIPF